MSPLIIAIIILVFAGAGILGFIMNKKQKQAAQQYEGEEGLKQASAIQNHLLQSKFVLLKNQMQNEPVDAFTECAYIATAGNKVASAAATAAKTVAWAAVGVKARYQETDSAAYLVLSGKDVHYVFFEEGEAKQHLIFDENRLRNAQKTEITSAEKVTRMGAIMGQKPNKISIDLDGSNIDLLYYNEVRRMPDTIITMSRDMMETRAKLGLMGRFFNKKLQEKYPHLYY